MVNPQMHLSAKKGDNRIANKFGDKEVRGLPQPPVYRAPENAKAQRRVVKITHSLPVTDVQPLAFSSSKFAEAIKNAKPSKALGPDGILRRYFEMLKHLVLPGVKFMTEVLNMSL